MKNKFPPLNDFELGWLVGILEGEGYFGYQKYSYRINVKMTDLDTIQRVAALFARITGKIPPIHDAPNKTTNETMPYIVSLHGENARVVMKLVVPHMSWRRRQRIWQSLNKFSPASTLSVSNIIELCKVRSNG